MNNLAITTLICGSVLRFLLVGNAARAALAKAGSAGAYIRREREHDYLEERMYQGGQAILRSELRHL